MNTEHYKRMEEACDTGDRKELAAVIRDAKASLDDTAYQKLLLLTSWDLCSRKNADLLRTVVEADRHLLDWIEPRDLAKDVSRDVLETVVDLGWDINRRDENPLAFGSQLTLLGHLCADEDLVRWCLDHGASVQDDAAIDPHTTPPVLDSIAGRGTVTTFKLVRSHGARYGPRALHFATDAAAVSTHRNDSQEHADRMEMLKYLVEELKLDVNARDTEEPRHRHKGTPICYAVTKDKTGEVVRYLLDHGADPTIVDSWGTSNAITLAERNDKVGIAKMLYEESAKKPSTS